MQYSRMAATTTAGATVLATRVSGIGLAVAAMSTVQLGGALSKPLFDDIGPAGVAPDIAAVHPPLADVLGVSTAGGIGAVADALLKAMGRTARPEVASVRLRREETQSSGSSARRAEVIDLLRAKDVV